MRPNPLKAPASEDERLRVAIDRLTDIGKLPSKHKLEAVVEDTGKCQKCAGGVRASLDEVHLPSSPAQDLEFLVSLRCRDAACAWTARQWRPWSQASPMEL